MILNLRKTLAAAAIASAICTSPVALADNTTGSVYGQAAPGAEITILNLNTGLKKTYTVENDGKFNFKNLPTGKYEVTSSNGKKREILVTIGTGNSVNFTAESSDSSNVVQILGSRIRSIDTSSSESTSIYTSEMLESIPVSRDITSVAVLTPGTVLGDNDFGNLPSFGGSSVAENGYYIDGFDVTNIRTFLNFARLPFEAIDQVQVKTGGYGAEYGRSLGGVTNIVTKSGGNEFEFGGAVYWTPDSLRSPRQDVIDRASTDGTLTIYNSDDAHESITYNVFASGPIIKDQLFFYANLEGRQIEDNWYGRQTSTHQEINTPNAIVKLDWYLTDAHRLTATYIQNNTDEDKVNYQNPDNQFYTGAHGDEIASVTEENGGSITVLNYFGEITDDFSVRAMYGHLKNDDNNRVPRALPGGDCPLAWDTRGDRTWSQRTPLGCWNLAQSTVVDLEAPSDSDERKSYKVDFEYLLGEHTIRFGYDNEDWTTFSPGITYTGNAYYRYLTGNAANGGIINNVDVGIGTEVVRLRTYNTQTGAYGVENTSMYLEDSWFVTEDIMLYAAIRNETFTNLDANGNVFVESDKLMAPRLGFSWDINGDSTEKAYASLGRYYIPIAANTNVRATRTETFTQAYYYYTGIDSATGAPTSLGNQFGNTILDEQIPDPRVIAVSDLSPMFQDELILGYQREINSQWTGGVKFIYRKIKDGMDDFCAHDGFVNWAADNGHTNFDPGSMSGCLIVNPGNDLSLYMDLENDGNVTHVTVPNSYFNLPSYKRSYKGLEFTAEKSFSDNWFASFSYVYAKSEGNIEGYVNSSLGQEDAGATQDFDHSRFQDGSDGYLPNDHRHQLKGYGYYQLTDELQMSMNVSIVSGTPVSCFGYIPLDGMIDNGSTDYDYANFERYSASSFYCKNESGVSELHQRGEFGRTPWIKKVDLGLEYVPEWADNRLTLKADIFNLFNFDGVTELNQRKDLARDNNGVNPNFLAPTGFQSPRSVRLTARYTF